MFPKWTITLFFVSRDNVEQKIELADDCDKFITVGPLLPQKCILTITFENPFLYKKRRKK